MRESYDAEIEDLTAQIHQLEREKESLETSFEAQFEERFEEKYQERLSKNCAEKVQNVQAQLDHVRGGFQFLKKDILQKVSVETQRNMAVLKRMGEVVQDYRQRFLAESGERRKLHNLVQELRGNIRVYCRVRPLLNRERGPSVTFP